MKQAQQMQENMKQDAGGARDDRGRGPVGRRHGQGGDDLQARRQARHASIRRLLADDKDMLEDLVAAAVNDAVARVEATVQEKMAGFTAGLPLPPGMKLPF